MSSTHKAEVVKLGELLPIEGADRIGYVMVHGGYPCVVSKEDYEAYELWVYITPDSLVDSSRGEFAFLNDKFAQFKEVDGKQYVRIRARKFKKQPSMGLLIPAPRGARLGQDLAKSLGILHYEPPTPGTEHLKEYGWVRRRLMKWANRANRYARKGLQLPYYDIEALRRYPEVFAGANIVVTEKLHGSNAAYVWGDYRPWWFPWINRPRLLGRSRTVWRDLKDKSHIWAQAVTPELERFCKENPNLVLFGEIVGPGVQDLEYGLEKPTFFAFDIYDSHSKSYLNWYTLESFLRLYDILQVPQVTYGRFELDSVLRLAEGPSLLANHCREGIVVKTIFESAHPQIGRMILKAVGSGYLERSK